MKKCEHKWSIPVIAEKKHYSYAPDSYIVISCEKCGEIKKERI